MKVDFFRSKIGKRSLVDAWAGWSFAFPCLVILGMFILYPAVLSAFLSFHEVEPVSQTRIFMGWDQYRELLGSKNYLQSLKTTLFFVLLCVPTSVGISVLLAVLLDHRPYVSGFFRTIFLLPVGISPAMAAMLWIFLYNPTAGLLNYVLKSVWISSPPAWLTDPNWALVAVSIATVWKEIGFNMIFILAGLATVPKELKEAAHMDGAHALQKFMHVTLPMISPSVFFVTVVSMIHAFESFGQIHVLTRGGPANATNVLVYQLYRDGFENFRAGLASAQAVLLFVMILLVTALQMYIAKSRVHYR